MHPHGRGARRLSCALTAAPALALNSIGAGTPSLKAHFNTVHLRVPYTGDDNRNATVLGATPRPDVDAAGADTAVAVLDVKPGGSMASRRARREHRVRVPRGRDRSRWRYATLLPAYQRT
jgi:hypothetical protein